MTDELKRILFLDLSARVPHNTMIQLLYKGKYLDLKLKGVQEDVFGIGGTAVITEDGPHPIENAKPYLRRMNDDEDLTEDELWEYQNTIMGQLQDFFGEYHFDNRHMIDLGLAIEVTDDNNPYKEEEDD